MCVNVCAHLIGMIITMWRFLPLFLTFLAYDSRFVQATCMDSTVFFIMPKVGISLELFHTSTAVAVKITDPTNMKTLTSAMLYRDFFEKELFPVFDPVEFDWITSIAQKENGTWLQYLDVSNNAIEKLTAGTFQNVSRCLLHLSIENNPGIQIAPGAFHGLDDLLKLNLMDNSLRTLDSAQLEGMPSLQTLVLLENDLKVINGQVFKNLPKLEHLELGNNSLETLADSVLEDVPNLQILSLVYNSLRSFQPNRCPRLQVLDVSSNKLNTVNFSNCTALRFLGVTHNKFKKLENLPIALERVYAYSNEMEAITLGNLPNLRLVDVSANRFKNISDFALYEFDTLEILNMSYNDLTSFDPKGLPKLEVLDLSHNKLNTFEKKYYNFPELKTLSLAYNMLVLKAGMFSNLPKLLTLELQCNGIETIPPKAFSGLISLKHLYLDDNNIKEIVFGSFAGISNLLTLSVAKNQLATINENKMVELQNLGTLVLDGNKLKGMNVTSVKLKLPMLEFISLGGMPWNCDELSHIKTELYSRGINIKEVVADHDDPKHSINGIHCELGEHYDLYNITLKAVNDTSAAGGENATNSSSTSNGGGTAENMKKMTELLGKFETMLQDQTHASPNTDSELTSSIGTIKFFVVAMFVCFIMLVLFNIFKNKIRSRFGGVGREPFVVRSASELQLMQE